MTSPTLSQPPCRLAPNHRTYMVLAATHHISAKTFFGTSTLAGQAMGTAQRFRQEAARPIQAADVVDETHRLPNQLQLCAEFLSAASPGPEYVLAAKRFTSFVISYNDLLNRPKGSPFAFASPTIPQIVTEGPQDIQPRTPLRPGVPLHPLATMSYCLPPAPHRT